MALTPPPIDLFISVGEPSGDSYGAELIKALPHLAIAARSGPKMREEKALHLFKMEELEVMGFTDVVKHLPRILKVLNSTVHTLLALNPKAILCIDYPGFHLKLEKMLRKKGYQGKLIHYISPSVWAWKKNRIKTMEKHLDLLLTILPFEKKFFEESSLPVLFAGHPLVNRIPPHHTQREPLIAIFPGSRKEEIERNLPLQLECAKKLQELDPTLQIKISDYRKEDNYDLMKRAKIAIATSGTVTLELALHDTPTVVTFAIRPFDAFLAQKIFRINLPFYSLPNLITGEEIFPEFFGPHLTLDALFNAAKNLLTSSPPTHKVRERLTPSKAPQILDCFLKEVAVHSISL